MKSIDEKWSVDDWINEVLSLSEDSDQIQQILSLNLLDNIKIKPIKAIVGESPYPKNPLLVPNWLYYFDFPEIAFLKTEYTLDMVSILSIMFDSMDDGIKFLRGIKGSNNSFRNNRLLAFAALLFLKERIVLINRNDSQSHYRNTEFSKIVQCLDKILVVGKSKQSNDFQKKIKNKNYLVIIHPSPRNYSKNAPECCHTYFERTISSQNGVSLSDFKIV